MRNYDRVQEIRIPGVAILLGILQKPNELAWFPISMVAISVALGMTGVLYTSVRLGEDWLRAALYLIVFVTLSLTGPGRFSLDRCLQIRKTNRFLGTTLPSEP